MWPVMLRLPADGRGASSMRCCCSRAAMSASVSQIGISIATVTLSLASMNRCSVSCRSLLLPTAGMMSAAVCVAAFSFRLTMMRDASAQLGVACEARALGSSRVKSSCGQVVGMLSRKSDGPLPLLRPGRCPERRGSASSPLLCGQGAEQARADAQVPPVAASARCHSQVRHGPGVPAHLAANREAGR